MLRTIGPYRLQDVIGRGGLGVVHQALDPDDRTVAVKLLNRPSADAVAAQRLIREFTEISGLNHRNIVRVIDVGVEEDTPYLAMEYVDGVPLRRFLETAAQSFSPAPPTEDSSQPEPEADSKDVSTEDHASGPSELPAWLAAQDEADSLDPKPKRCPASQRETLTPEIRAALNHPDRIRRLRDAVSQVCDGLAYLHAHGLVHRDVKPSNVLVTADGCAKLVDFGLVKSTFVDSSTTATGHIVGTYRYMSPEQARSRRLDGRSDLYAVGGILYEMLCVHPPFAHTQAADLVHAIVYEAPVPIRQINPEADETLAAIAERLLHKSPGARYSSAEEVARRLRAGHRSA